MFQYQNSVSLPHTEVYITSQSGHNPLERLIILIFPYIILDAKHLTFCNK